MGNLQVLINNWVFASSRQTEETSKWESECVETLLEYNDVKVDNNESNVSKTTDEVCLKEIEVNIADENITIDSDEYSENKKCDEFCIKNNKGNVMNLWPMIMIQRILMKMKTLIIRRNNRELCWWCIQRGWVLF